MRILADDMTEIHVDAEGASLLDARPRLLLVCGRWIETHSTYRILKPIVDQLHARFRVCKLPVSHISSRTSHDYVLVVSLVFLLQQL